VRVRIVSLLPSVTETSALPEGLTPGADRRGGRGPARRRRGPPPARRGLGASDASGEPSRRVAWEEVAAARPDVIICAPCGLGLEAAVAVSREALAAGLLPSGVPVWAVDANASYARPGPRLVDGVEALAGILHPRRAGPPDPRAAQILRSTPVTTPASVTSPSGTIGA
jgi:ABC-type Fe3+-hydroxamate transport system substrate-binding protein